MEQFYEKVREAFLELDVSIKKKIIAALTLGAIFTVISLYLSYNLKYIFLGRLDMLTLNFFKVLFGLLDEHNRRFFLIFMGMSFLAIIYFVSMQGYIKYKSDMQVVAPGIETPKAEGQGQYGTARWLDSKKMGTAFSEIEFNTSDAFISNLVQHGYDDLNADTSTDTKSESQEDNGVNQ